MDGRTLDIKNFDKIKKFDKIRDLKRFKEEHLRYAFDNANLDGYMLEFGVYVGNTMRRICKFTNQEIFGFDSFEGLPEPWQWNSTKTMTMDRFKVDKLPAVPPQVTLVKGWFKDTIPEWKKDHTGPIKFMHIDSDLYSSAITVLTELNDQILPDTVIVFDELLQGENNYEYWEQGEWKALHEWCDEYNREYIPIAKTHRNQATIKIIK